MAVVIAQHLASPSPDDRHHGIGGAEIDAHRQPAIVLCGQGVSPGSWICSSIRSPSIGSRHPRHLALRFGVLGQFGTGISSRSARCAASSRSPRVERRRMWHWQASTSESASADSAVMAWPGVSASAMASRFSICSISRTGIVDGAAGGAGRPRGPRGLQQVGGALERVLQGLVGIVQRGGLRSATAPSPCGDLGGEAVGMQPALKAEILALQQVDVDVEGRRQPQPGKMVHVPRPLHRAAHRAEQRAPATGPLQDQHDKAGSAAEHVHRPPCLRRGRIRRSRNGPFRWDCGRRSPLASCSSTQSISVPRMNMVALGSIRTVTPLSSTTSSKRALLVGELQRIAEPRAALGAHADADARRRLAALGQHGLDPLGGGVGDGEGPSVSMRRPSFHLLISSSAAHSAAASPESVFFLVVGDRRLDRILGQHRTMDLYRRQRQFAGRCRCS